MYAKSLACPWKRVLLHYLRPGQSLESIYRAVGWSKNMALNRSRWPDLMTSEIAALADAVRAPRAEFFLRLCLEMDLNRPSKLPLKLPKKIRPRGPGRPRSGSSSRYARGPRAPQPTDA